MEPIDALQALAVERVMRCLPEDHRRVLVLFYVARLPYRQICRILHRGYDMWDRFFGDAQRMVANLLKISKNPLQYTHGYGIDMLENSIPAHAEIPEPVGSGCIG